MLDKTGIAKRIAQEVGDGMYINLGIGIPTLVANYIPSHLHVVLQSENGLLGIGPFPTESKIDPDLINAGKQTITMMPGSALFNSAESFAIQLSRKFCYDSGWPRGSYYSGSYGSFRKWRYRQLESAR